MIDLYILLTGIGIGSFLGFGLKMFCCTGGKIYTDEYIAQKQAPIEEVNKWLQSHGALNRGAYGLGIGAYQTHPSAATVGDYATYYGIETPKEGGVSSWWKSVETDEEKIDNIQSWLEDLRPNDEGYREATVVRSDGEKSSGILIHLDDNGVTFTVPVSGDRFGGVRRYSYEELLRDKFDDINNI